MPMTAPKTKRPGRTGTKARANAKAQPKKPRAAAASAPVETPAAQPAPGMTAVQVKFMGDLPTVVGQRTVLIELPVASTVEDLLAVLSERYGEAFTARVFQAPGKLHHYILLFVDGVKVPGDRSAWSRTLAGGEVDVVMLPMFGGG